MNSFTGLMAAPFAPFDNKGKLALAQVPLYVEKLIADGLKGIFVCGSNGEGPNMTTEERMLTAEAFKEAAGSRLKVFVHVGNSSIAESQKLALHASKIKADAISSVASFYFKPNSEQNLVEALAEMTMLTPEIPFYYYHIPHLTGISMDMVTFLKLAEKRIPNMAGIKYTAATIWEYQLCLNYEQGKFDMLYGFDEMMLPALAAGAKGMIGSTFNFAAPLYLDLIETFNAGNIDEARKKMLYLVQMVKIILGFPPIAAQKAIMKKLGIDLGPCRLPLPTMSPADETSLYQQLNGIGFFEKLLAYSNSNGVAKKV